MDSVQQRTPKVAPRRQLRSPQHIASVEHVAASGAHVHCDEEKSQSAHVPLLGPVESPETHWPLVAQKPHSARAVQSRHVALSEHVSSTGQLLASQLHVPHVPREGPVDVPELHVPVAAHQPHEGEPVHDAQSVFDAHSSTGPAHSLAVHAQAPRHVPDEGPVDVPERHAPSQNPQPDRAVHASQPVASTHGSVGPLHSLATQAHPAHEPVEGPLAVPALHEPVALHQPQG
jgi:hypothetical protein